MNKRIRSIRLEAFRGATTRSEINFDKKPVVMLFGENGTGKSSIIDAIDLICNQRAGSLDERGSANNSHLPTLGKTYSDVNIEITFGTDAWTSTLNRTRPVREGPGTPPAALILRRSQLLRLVEAAPAERYKEVSRFIDVVAIERCEETLSKAARSASNRLAEAIRVKQEAEESLDRLWQAEGRPGTNAKAWAQEQAGADTSTLKVELERLNALKAAFTALGMAEDAIAEATAGLKQSETRFDELTVALDQLAASGESSFDIVELLTQVKTFIALPRQFEACPVCDQTVDAAELRREVDNRLQQMAESRRLHENLTAAKRNLDHARTNLERAQTNLVEIAQQVANLVANAVATTLKHHLLLINSVRANEDGIQPTLHQVTLYAQHVRSCCDELYALIESKSQHLHLYNALKVNWDKIWESEQEVLANDAVRKHLESTHALVREKRHAFTQAVLDAVSDECKRLYDTIHPGEPVAFSGIALHKERRASLEQSATFGTHADIPPQAYFSESHLDTLGFCFWLAIAHRATGGNAIIILDDVFTSVDAPHLRRILELVAAESERFEQIIITTHNRMWLDYHRQSKIEAGIEMVLLNKWSIDRGITTSKSKPAVVELEQTLQSLPFDRQAVASKAGILLEAILDHLALQHRFKMERKPNNDYTLRELLDSTASFASKAEVERPQPDGTVERVALKGYVEAIDELAFVRNQVGAHFNQNSVNLADADVEEFGLRTLSLAHLLVCQGCGVLPKLHSKTKTYRCGCKAPKTPTILHTN